MPVTGSESTDCAIFEKTLLVALREQRSSRRWRNFWRFVWLLIFLAIVVFVVGAGRKKLSSADGPHTAFVRVDGEIASGGQSSAANIIAGLDAAFDDANTKAVLLSINSPGGSPVQAGMVYDEIRRLEDKHKNIPVYAVIEDVGASGAYYIAAAADKIFVNQASIVGSIGVIMEGFGASQLLQKIGVERRVITAGDNKDMMDPFMPQNPVQKAYMQSLINQVHQQFIDAVVKGRGDRLKITPQTFSGLVWTGQDAVNIGLADGLNSVDGVARDVVHAPVLVDYTHYDDMTARLVKRLGVSLGKGVAYELSQVPGFR